MMANIHVDIRAATFKSENCVVSIETVLDKGKTRRSSWTYSLQDRVSRWPPEAL